jgi:aspartate carbamoyltransferase catalytic subunit
MSGEIMHSRVLESEIASMATFHNQVVYTLKPIGDKVDNTIYIVNKMGLGNPASLIKVTNFIADRSFDRVGFS